MRKYFRMLIFFLMCNTLIYSQKYNFGTNEIDSLVCLQLYPLQIGNKWIYLHESCSNTYFGTEYYSDTVYKEIIGDTLLLNDKRYYTFSEHSNNSKQNYYERLDLLEDIVYRFDIDKNIEYAIDYLYTKTGDTTDSQRFGYDTFSESSGYQIYTVFESDSMMFVFSETFYSKHFQSNDLEMHNYVLMQDIGLYEDNYQFDFGSGWYYLKYANINNKEYGDLDFLSIKNGENTLYKFELKQNYPNPFNSVTKVKYEINKRNQVTCTIFNIQGRQIKTLVSEYQKPGQYEVSWNASDNSSGLYIIQLKVGNLIQNKKCLFLR